MSSGEGVWGWAESKKCGKMVATGEVSEWLKEHAWKACMRATVSGVRIPISSPEFPHEGDFLFCDELC